MTETQGPPSPRETDQRYNRPLYYVIAFLILGALIVAGGYGVYSFITLLIRSYLSLPEALAATSATSVLNDIAVVNGILVGFSSITAARNLEEIDNLKKDFRAKPRDLVRTAVQSLFSRRVLLVMLDIVTIILSLTATMESLFAVASITTTTVGRGVFLQELTITYFVILLIIVRIILEVVA